MIQAATAVAPAPCRRQGTLHDRFFDSLLGRQLIFNTCWEDPALDRVALNLTASDRVLVITSAGCNALDYLLAGAGEVHAVDLNPCQNALLELKIAAIRSLPYDRFFRLFGEGGMERVRDLYLEHLRPHLGTFARRYWDRHIRFFESGGLRPTFYYRGTAGFCARLLVAIVKAMPDLRGPIDELVDARSLEEQRRVYGDRIRDRLWRPGLKWFLSRKSILSLLGVPRGQLDEMLARYPGGAADYIRECFEAVATRLPFSSNYFWRVYFHGRYTEDCCPEYLRRSNFERLRTLVDRVHLHAGTVAGHLQSSSTDYSRFVLLDHMDWMRDAPEALEDEWTAILDRARPRARAIFRSAGRDASYLDPVRVGRRKLTELLTPNPDLAAELHARDRVHTYGSFHIMDLPS